MRNGQHQVEAEKALSFAMSVRPSSEGRTLKEVVFLAGIMLNTTAPCSITSLDQRFQAACSLLLDYADKHPKDRMAYFLLFITYAIGSTRARQRLAEKTGISDVGAVTQQFAQGSTTSIRELEQAALAQECEDFAAKAAKYLELSRTSTEAFSGTLGGIPGDPEASFQDFSALLRRERLNRSEVAEPPAERPTTPEGWQQDKEVITQRSVEFCRLQTEGSHAFLLICAQAHLLTDPHQMGILAGLGGQRLGCGWNARLLILRF